ncbi:MAG: hypothetical protein J5933_04895 [Clostridia bacterium]|nr:hypothetical protein [Clostridia bacterium]
MKKIISLLLVILFCAALFSCVQDPGGNGGTVTSDRDSGDSGQEDTSDPFSDTVKYYEPDKLPDDIGFAGEKVTVLSVSEAHFTGDILVDELTSDPVNDSVFNREKYVEDRLGVEIEGVTVSTGEFNNTVTLQSASDDNDYQILAGSTVWYTPIVFDDLVTDLYEVDYLDFSAPWWSGRFASEAEMGGRLFFITGSLALSTNRFLIATFYNKKLAEDYKSSYPDLEDLFTLVDEGKWTVDRLMSISSDIFVDLDGDSESGADDVYGFGIVRDYPIDAVWSSFDMRILGRDEDGWFELDLNKEKIFSVLEKMQTLLFGCRGSYPNEGDQAVLEQKFASGTLLFMIGQLKSAETPDLRNMQDDYGLVPFPKYDEEQSDYYTFAHDQYISFSIPRTNPSPDVAGAVLEAMASYAYRDTIPKYLDTVIKGKYMSDAKSRHMVDLIVDGFRMDAGWIYSNKIGYFAQMFREAVMDNSDSYASSYVKTYNVAKIALKDLKAKYSVIWAKD